MSQRYIWTVALMLTLGASSSVPLPASAEPEMAANCALLRHEDVAGIAATVYRYERQIQKDYNVRVEMWISKETGLPLKSHFRALPLDNISERRLTYTYGDDVKAPI